MHEAVCQGFTLTVSRAVKLQIIPVLHPQPEEIEEPIIREFTNTNDFCYYVEDREVSCYCISVVVLEWGTARVGFLCYIFSHWCWLSVQAVLCFEEWLRRVRDSLCKEKEAHASKHAKLELWKARVAQLQSTVADSSVHAYVRPQVTRNNKDGVHVSHEMGSPGHDKPHMEGEHMGTACGFPTAKINSVVETDMEEDVGVRTENVMISQAGEPGMTDMETKVRPADEAETSMPGAETIEGGDGDIYKWG